MKGVLSLLAVLLVGAVAEAASKGTWVCDNGVCRFVPAASASLQPAETAAGPVYTLQANGQVTPSAPVRSDCPTCPVAAPSAPLENVTFNTQVGLINIGSFGGGLFSARAERLEDRGLVAGQPVRNAFRLISGSRCR